MNEPRIWGEWDPRFYGSGTTIVCLRAERRRPHLYIHADAAIDEDRRQSDRYVMCQQLADFMNGGKRPAWLDDFERTSEIAAKSLAGGSIEAVGPMVDKDPPNLFWVTDESEAAANDRARLMDALFFVAKEKA